MPKKISVGSLSKKELKATEKFMIEDITDLYFDFKFQQHVQETTGEYVSLDAIEMTRKMLNLFSLTEHRLSLLEAGKDQETDTSRLQSIFKVKIEQIE